MEIRINGQGVATAPEWHDESLLNVLREHLGLVGAKFGCGVGLCGACTVLVDGEPQRSCLVRTKDIGARSITTIEGLADGASLHAVQQAWLDEAVPQCGYCQAGQVMATVALLRTHARPTDAQIDEALSGHLCRCGTQQRIRRAVHRAAGQTR
ncbi:MAG TPA: (2Fe-2S)-binding protein [Ideonella sp.]|uniref:(2Fe-2S)-binding protein n=1 Tax=Ideonella sp. TaxID=1929293 RepID=UPI002E324F8E|nr:(2Fe-2S)-binding protein [Ideonella sp.]HEX5683951.1 (2Fe-2S)-binding protein [Ideonella sp.]